MVQFGKRVVKESPGKKKKTKGVFGLFQGEKNPNVDYNQAPQGAFPMIEELENAFAPQDASQPAVSKSTQAVSSSDKKDEEMYRLMATMQAEIRDLRAEKEAAQKETSQKPADSNEVMSLLAELKGDITSMKEQTPASQSGGGINNEDGAIMELLAELEGDISKMKAAAAEPVTAPAEDSMVMDLLAELKGDITTMKSEASVPSSEDSMVMDLLAELKGDITTMKSEASAPSSEDSMVMDLLAELKGDITTMKSEVSAPSSEDSMVMDLLAELKGDITTMKSSAPSQDSEVMNLLAELKGDITTMKSEAPAEDSMVMDLLAELKGDITTMKSTAPSQDSEVMDLLAELKGDITTMKSETPAEDSMVMDLLAELKGDISTMKAETPPSSDVSELTALVNELRGDISSMKEESVAPTNTAMAGTATDDPLIMTVNVMMEEGNVIPARKVLQYAVDQGNAGAQFKLGESYDPAYLEQLEAETDAKPDVELAKEYYYKAASQGYMEATIKLSQMD